MRSDEREIEAAALGLEKASRGRLARRLIESLEELDQTELEALWVEEAHRRSEELSSGAEVALPGEEVLRQIEDEIS